MNQLLEKEIKVENLIYEIRGKQVMLDSDLGRLYNIQTKRVNEAVKNNIEKFPLRFSWVLTENEWVVLRSKYSTLESDKTKGRGHYRKYLPRVFTEQGVAMLATIIKSEVATRVSIRIMDAFVTMKKYISTNLLEQRYINNLVLEDHDKIKLLQESFKRFEKNEKETDIFFNGQIFDAYSKILDIFKEANNELIIVDGYADNTLLDIVKRLSVKVILVTKPNNLLTGQDITKYNMQYSNLKVIYDKTFHDRYFILDKSIVYHCGTSINRIGYKTFSITKIGDTSTTLDLINRINCIIKTRL